MFLEVMKIVGVTWGLIMFAKTKQLYDRRFTQEVYMTR